VSEKKDTIREFTTAEGITLKLRPVSAHLLLLAQIPVEDDFRARGEPIDPPTYTSRPNAAGEISELPLTAEILNTFADDPQEKDVKAKWARYLAARGKLAEAQAEARLQAELALGIDFDIPDDEETREWFEQVEQWLRVPVPSNPQDRKVFYLIHKPILTALEIQEVEAQISMLSSGVAVDPQQVALFRKSAASSVGKELANRLEQAIRILEPVASGPEVHGAEDGEGVEDPAG